MTGKCGKLREITKSHHLTLLVPAGEESDRDERERERERERRGEREGALWKIFV